MWDILPTMDFQRSDLCALKKFQVKMLMTLCCLFFFSLKVNVLFERYELVYVALVEAKIYFITHQEWMCVFFILNIFWSHGVIGKHVCFLYIYVYLFASRPLWRIPMYHSYFFEWFARKYDENTNHKWKVKLNINSIIERLNSHKFLY